MGGNEGNGRTKVLPDKRLNSLGRSSLLPLVINEEDGRTKVLPNEQKDYAISSLPA
jgi:hypothetical protein